MVSPNLPMMVSVSEMPSVGGTLQGTASKEVVGVGPQPGDDADSTLRDSVVLGANDGGSRSAALAAPGYSRTGVWGCLGCAHQALPVVPPHTSTRGGWGMR
jgi:hypothetical protein